MQTWFVLDQSSAVPSPTGPYTLAQLEAMAREGRLHETTLVAAAGTQSWIPASTDPLLAGLFRSVPPTSPDGVGAFTAPLARGPFSFGAAFGLGWKSVTSRWSQWLVLGVAWLALTMVLGLPQWIPQILGGMASESDSSGVRATGALLTGVGGCIGLILQVLVGIPLFAGVIYACAEIHDGRGQIGDLFQGFRRYGSALLSGLLLVCIYMACGIAAAIPMALTFGVMVATSRGGGPAPFWAFVGIAAMVLILILLIGLVLMRVLFAPVIAIDPRFGTRFGTLGVMDAFGMSWRNTQGLGFSMLLLLVVVSVLAALSILLLCVGYILIGIPLMLSVLGAMYVLTQRSRLDAPAVG